MKKLDVINNSVLFSQKVNLMDFNVRGFRRINAHSLLTLSSGRFNSSKIREW